MNEKTITDAVLNVLSLEDSVLDFRIISEQLTDAGFNIKITNVEKELEFTALIRNNKYDIILADFSLPGFHAFKALQLCNEICPDIPFICVSGAIGEETAIELLRLGAVDYIMKDKLEKLPFAVKRAIDEAKEKVARRQVQEDLRKNEEKYSSLYSMFRLMADNIDDFLWAKDIDKKFIFVNKTICEKLLFATSIDEPIGKTDMFFATRERESHPENPDWHNFGEICADSDTITINERKPTQFDEFGNVKGKFLFLDVHKAPIWDEHGNIIGVVGTARDATLTKQLEKEKFIALELLQKSEEKYRNLVDKALIAIYTTNLKGKLLFANDAMCKMLEYD